MIWWQGGGGVFSAQTSCQILLLSNAIRASGSIWQLRKFHDIIYYY